MIILDLKIEKSDLIGNTPHPDKGKIVWYMKKAPVVAYACGIARDVMTREYIHSPWSLQSDGEYEWDSYVWYYVEKYDYPLPADFVEKILKSDLRALWLAWRDSPYTS